MSRLQNFSRQASADLDDAVSWLLDRGGSAGRAEKLLRDMQAVGARIAERPLLGRRRLDLLPDPFRFWSLPRHRLLLVYRSNRTPATVLRVLHMARDLAPLLADIRAVEDDPPAV